MGKVAKHKKAAKGGLFQGIYSLFSKNINVSMPFQDKKDPASSLTKAYITAFMLIAFISIAVHFITSSITELQQASIRHSYFINHERALVEQISSISAKHFNMGEDLDHDFLEQAVDQMEENHKKIVSALAENSILNPSSKVLTALYYEQPFSLDKNIKEYIEKARLYVSYETDDNSKEREETFQYLQRKARSLLQPILNKALADYQNEVIAKISLYHYIQLGGLLIILVVLLIEASFIFHPLASRTRAYHNMLLKQALEDPLTGLNNRRAFMNRADSEMKRTYRDSQPMIVALTDLDHFKSVNDTYGHDVGDAVLKHFANVLKKSLRGGDIIGRIGGEEFAVILPRTGIEKGSEVLERLCRDVENNPCPYLSETGSKELLKYTVSIGFSDISLNDTTQSIDDLLKKADEALYFAKENGRNRAVFIGDAVAA